MILHLRVFRRLFRFLLAVQQYMLAVKKLMFFPYQLGIFFFFRVINFVSKVI